MVRHYHAKRMACRLAQFVREDAGMTALEYGLMTALIALAIAGAVTMFSSNAEVLFTTIANTI